MNNFTIIFTIAALCILMSCRQSTVEKKGFAVTDSETLDENKNSKNGLKKDSLNFDTRPSSVLRTGIPNIRLTTIYKVNISKKSKKTFIGANRFHFSYGYRRGNNWNNNIMPGLRAAYGYNMVNISHYDIEKDEQRNFFKKPVLVNTLYYPTHTQDTLNHEPIKRNYFFVSVYDEDTNKDGFINQDDLRRLYLFDLNGEKQQAVIPKNYAVLKSEYDLDNDFMYVFAQLDQNNNGQRDEGEPMQVFWIDLKDPSRTGRSY